MRNRTATSQIESGKAWMLYYRSHLPSRWKLVFSHGEEKVEAEFTVRAGRGFDSTIAGKLLGQEYFLEAFGRNRRPEDESESELVFTGTFEHENGCSGDFTARPTRQGELLRLGVYGTAQMTRLSLMNTRWRNGPVELSGPARVSLRLETGLNLPELVIPNH